MGTRASECIETIVKTSALDRYTQDSMTLVCLLHASLFDKFHRYLGKSLGAMANWVFSGQDWKWENFGTYFYRSINQPTYMIAVDQLTLRWTIYHTEQWPKTVYCLPSICFSLEESRIWGHAFSPVGTIILPFIWNQTKWHFGHSISEKRNEYSCYATLLIVWPVLHTIGLCDFSDL